jgi:hypothetical protein
VPIEVTHLVVYPNRARMDMNAMGMGISRAFDGEKGWVKGPQGVMDLPESQASDLRQTVERDSVALLLALAKPDAKPVHRGQETIDGAALDVVEVSPDLTIYFDPAGHLVRRVERGPQGALTTVWSDFKEVAGVQFPYTTTKSVEGEEVASITAKTIEVNVEVPADAFAKPAGPEAKPGGSRK